MYVSYMCDTGWIGHPHNNFYVSQCKKKCSRCKCHNARHCDTWPIRCRIKFIQ